MDTTSTKGLCTLPSSCTAGESQLQELRLVFDEQKCKNDP